MSDPRQSLPAVHTLLAEMEREVTDVPRALLVTAIRAAVDDARRSGGAAPAGGWASEVRRRVAALETASLRRVVNATGVVLHTNLGRAPLAAAARAAMADTAGYDTLEYDLARGERGSRQSHVRNLLTELTGAEDALVVTNAAAATIIVLNTIAAGGETIVSRGELVEIGGGFRIPTILEKSGTVLREVGTTNRTHLPDYVGALSPRTRCVLKVHRSNFRITGFTNDVALDALIADMTPRGVPVVHDIGSGLLIDLSPFGLTGEPLVRDSVAAGATVVFSGDKLLGGPQAGVIVGPAATIAAAAGNPFTRAMRPGKTVLAALEATLALYRDPDVARRDIPTLAMLTADPATLAARADALAARIDGGTTEPGTSQVGGGSFPDADLPTTLVAVPTRHPDAALAAMRAHDPPVIGRAGEDRVLLDPRTLGDDELDAVASAVAGI